MSSFNEKMTAIANEVREISGQTEAMGLDSMATTLNAENANFQSNLAAQDNLIEQIQTALQIKTETTEAGLVFENYNSVLSSNNTDLQVILDIINEMPEQDLPASIQTCTVTFTSDVYPGNHGAVFDFQYTNENFEYVDEEMIAAMPGNAMSIAITVLKNTPIFFQCDSDSGMISLEFDDNEFGYNEQLDILTNSLSEISYRLMVHNSGNVHIKF